jgi:hypothetical protein
MLGLEQPNTSYMLISSSENLDQITSVLYAKNYQILPIKGYFEGMFEDSIMAFGRTDNDELRNDILFLLGHFNEKNAIIKYLGESEAKRVFFNGSEEPLEIVMYNTNESNKSYIHSGISFSFVEKTRYWKPKSQEDLKIGMVVEYQNNNKWYERIVRNPKEEWEKLYKLLTKYDKVRIPAKKLQYT